MSEVTTLPTEPPPLPHLVCYFVQVREGSTRGPRVLHSLASHLAALFDLLSIARRIIQIENYSNFKPSSVTVRKFFAMD